MLREPAQHCRDGNVLLGGLGLGQTQDTSHTSKFCSTGSATTKTFTPPTQSSYYLVVPRNATREGSYGTDSDDNERPQGLSSCLVRAIASCL